MSEHVKIQYGHSRYQSPSSKVMRWALFTKQNLRFGYVRPVVQFKVYEFLTYFKTISRGKNDVENIYRKVASRSTSWLVAHPRIFRLFMKEKFDAYVLQPFNERVQNWIVAQQSTAGRNFRGCSQTALTRFWLFFDHLPPSWILTWIVGYLKLFSIWILRYLSSFV
jgi:hypothetical protein